MTRERKPTLVLVLIVTAFLAMLLTGYIGGYYWLGDFVLWPAGSVKDRPKVERRYSQLWQMMLFHPASKVETWLRGIRVDVTCREHR